VTGRDYIRDLKTVKPEADELYTLPHFTVVNTNVHDSSNHVRDGTIGEVVVISTTTTSVLSQIHLIGQPTSSSDKQGNLSCSFASRRRLDKVPQKRQHLVATDYKLATVLVFPRFAVSSFLLVKVRIRVQVQVQRFRLRFR
jgi:hypothetical protein